MPMLVTWLALYSGGQPAHAGVDADIGYATVTSGRQIPAMKFGLTFGKDWAVSTMLAGMQSPLYYTSGIMMNALQTRDWGDFLFGRLEVGFGGGAYYCEKGLYTGFDQDGKPSNLQKDKDYVVGPAFRVAFKPVAHVHFSVEFLMGVGVSLFSNAWEDVGLGSIGVDL